MEQDIRITVEVSKGMTLEIRKFTVDRVVRRRVALDLADKNNVQGSPLAENFSVCPRSKPGVGLMENDHDS